MKNILWLIMAVCLLLPNRAESRDVEHVIRCESNGFTPEQCRFPLAPGNAEIKEVRMVRQHSTKPCIEGKSWEAGYGGITVTNGCRADFRIVYQLSDSDRYDRHDRHDRRRQYSEENRYVEENSWKRQDPTDIVLRAFAEILNRQPTREELREYRYLITRHDWSERQVRKDLRKRSYSEGRY
ncbi:MAG: hypothetical protein ACD_75C01575G0003 [uncultured bacterium]|nr:MAG: hypothetical protein ACD_75C01575G0003 [uncultured bacterium]HBG21125.1 hypothetical protein [Desulfobulbaceae bacterium]